MMGDVVYRERSDVVAQIGGGATVSQLLCSSG